MKHYLIAKIVPRETLNATDVKARVEKALKREFKGDELRVELLHDKLMCDEIKTPVASPAPAAEPESAPASQPDKKSPRGESAPKRKSSRS